MNFRLQCSIAAAVALSVGSCGGDTGYGQPTFSDGGLLRNSTAPLRSALMGLEGKFVIESGNWLFGDDVAIRTSAQTLTITSGNAARYGVLRPGCLEDGRAVFEGYWHGPREGHFGLIRLFLTSPAADEALCGGSGEFPSDVGFTGDFGLDAAAPSNAISLGERTPLTPFRGIFFSMAHHGACESTENCGASANSIETVRLAEQAGGNSIELDVRTTRDGVPILFHDPALSASLVHGTFCKGSIEELTAAEIRANCRLEHGEMIPTLDEALDVALDQTELEAFYVDLKVPEAMEPAVVAVQKINERAVLKGRTFRAVLALTKDSVTQAWLSKPRPASVPCLVEYDPELVIDLGCVAWGPTWTSGPHVEDVERLQKAGKRVVYWTMNHEDFIESYFETARPDGMITSRVGLVFYLYQKRGVLPGSQEPPQ